MQLVAASGAPFDLVAAGDPRTYADLITPAGLADIAEYADGLGPDKNQVIPRNADQSLGTPTALVDNAHAAGLVVHPYTFRNENTFLPANLRKGTNPADYGDALAEYEAFLATGIDGLFSDNADTARLAVDLLSD